MATTPDAPIISNLGNHTTTGPRPSTANPISMAADTARVDIAHKKRKKKPNKRARTRSIGAAEEDILGEEEQAKPAQPLVPNRKKAKKQKKATVDIIPPTTPEVDQLPRKNINDERGKRPARVTSRVPAVEGYRLRPLAGYNHTHRSHQAQVGRLKKNADWQALQWFKRVPVFRLPGVYFRVLQARPKNSDKDKQTAKVRMEEMEQTLEADAGSMIICDEEGVVLLAVFAYRLQEEVVREEGSTIDYRSAPYYPGPKGRTLADAHEMDAQVDGFKSEVIEDYHAMMQTVAHRVDPVCDPRDHRHDPTGNFMAYPDREGLEAPQQEVLQQKGPKQMYEISGVKHYVHCWPAQGFPNGILYPSGDTAKGGMAALVSDHYFRKTLPVSHGIRSRFKLAFPEYFGPYDEAFLAGQHNMTDPGPFLGRALVWKMQVLPHQDGLDEGPAAIFPSGYFEGGVLSITDLNLRLAYRPGHLAYLMAGQLYHAVEEWKPVASTGNESLTPGRASTVCFFPKLAYARLKGKRPKWNADTLSGTISYDGNQYASASEG
ncbi:hypothetical protein DFP72DRAFT_1067298 [Ephemerocybe angulata]|uniref:Uncharacterized protein n=1 Tax=Ephemerocybe angulata TaxID=980116 RepID=A0A8H6HZJ8_9AGAR|nr:hypothetical protein DFP72DRAFT_1067298 [Tulosesus angulatus]